MTQQPDHADLLGLLRGEFTNAEVAAAGQHLDACRECRDLLVETTVGHALLSGAVRTLRTAPVETSVTPEVPELAPLPRQPVRWLRPVGLVAAAAVLVASTAAVTSRLTQADPAPEVPVAGPTAQLDALVGSGAGEVVMASYDDMAVMTFETHDLPRAERGQFYYAWLLNPETNKMLPLGQISPDGESSFEVPLTLLTRYGAIDVSLEDDDGEAGHSVTSVLRGAYDPNNAELGA